MGHLLCTLLNFCYLYSFAIKIESNWMRVKWIKMDQNKGKMGQNKGKMGQNKGKMNQNGSK